MLVNNSVGYPLFSKDTTNIQRSKINADAFITVNFLLHIYVDDFSVHKFKDFLQNKLECICNWAVPKERSQNTWMYTECYIHKHYIYFVFGLESTKVTW